MMVIWRVSVSRPRRELRERMANMPADEGLLLIATGRFIGEGFDDARLDTLFLTMPAPWRGTLVQHDRPLSMGMSNCR